MTRRAAWYEPALERGAIPEWLVRLGIRRILRARLREQRSGQPERKARFIHELRSAPIAIETGAANVQHYDVPAAFFELVLGPHLKYSAGYWAEGVSTLAEAEAAMLALTCERAQLADGQRVLDLGCGWGSLSLYMASRFPASRIVALSNSASQRAFIEAVAARRGLLNLSVLTADVRTVDFSGDPSSGGPFDRIVSIEMFEHMRNYARLLRRLAEWLAPDGRLFVHLFVHRAFAYPYEARGAGDWMAEHFFTGGTMPSEDLLSHFQDDLVIERQWRVGGRHYARTCEAWLHNLQRNRREVDRVLGATYGAPVAPAIPAGARPDARVAAPARAGRGSGAARAGARAVRRWRNRWRIFFMACAELFAFRGGDEWFVAHYRFRRRS